MNQEITAWSALTTLGDQGAAEALGEALETLEPAPTGIGVFEIEDGSGNWEVGGFFDTKPDEVALALLAAAHEARPFEVSALPQVDWVAHVRRQLTPVEAGRFFLHGSHDADKVPEGRIGLLIDAAMAFGTGHHGTTLGCLLAFDRLLDGGWVPEKVADIGCGTAVLAMAAARAVPQAEVLAADIDPVAVEVAEANLSANEMAHRIKVYEAAGFDHPEIGQNTPFDLIFANILMGPLLDLAPSVESHANQGGHVILSGLLNAQADRVAAHYSSHGHKVVDRLEIGDWTTLILVRQ